MSALITPSTKIFSADTAPLKTPVFLINKFFTNRVPSSFPQSSISSDPESDPLNDEFFDILMQFLGGLWFFILNLRLEI